LTPETKVKREIVDYLDSLGSDCWHVAYHSMGYGRKGVPDRLCCYKGRFFALEVKADESKAPTSWQRHQIYNIVSAGGIAEVVWTVAHVKEVIARIDKLSADGRHL
jgi:hypothetical protein